MHTKDYRFSDSLWMVTKSANKSKDRTMCERLGGLKALIVGADTGLGRAISLAYAKEGCDLAINFQPENAVSINKLGLNIDDERGETVFLPKRLINENQCKELIDSVILSFGHIDVLVFTTQQPPIASNIEDLTTDRLQKIFEKNVLSLFWTIKAAQPYMRLGSSIIVTSSYQVYQPDANLSDYAAAEAAIMSFSHSVAKQFWALGIRVNIVVPIPVLKRNSCINGSNGFADDFKRPTDICQVYISLASKESRYVTDEVYNVVCNIPHF